MKISQLLVRIHQSSFLAKSKSNAELWRVRQSYSGQPASGVWAGGLALWSSRCHPSGNFNPHLKISCFIKVFACGSAMNPRNLAPAAPGLWKHMAQLGINSLTESQSTRSSSASQKRRSSYPGFNRSGEGTRAESLSSYYIPRKSCKPRFPPRQKACPYTREPRDSASWLGLWCQRHQKYGTDREIFRHDSEGYSLRLGHEWKHPMLQTLWSSGSWERKPIGLVATTFKSHSFHTQSSPCRNTASWRQKPKPGCHTRGQLRAAVYPESHFWMGSESPLSQKR